jgi:hypothetical protein
MGACGRVPGFIAFAAEKSSIRPFRGARRFNAGNCGRMRWSCCDFKSCDLGVVLTGQTGDSVDMVGDFGLLDSSHARTMS